MFQDNICVFVPYKKDYPAIHTINFVLETSSQKSEMLVSQSVYKMYYVCEGEGFLHTAKDKQPLSKGDVFFSLPGFPFAIEPCRNFKYMYVSFLGTRANMLMEKIHVSKQNLVFSQCDALDGVWKNGISTHPALSDLASESVLLATFAFIGQRSLENEKELAAKNNVSLYIKKYIDDNFTNPTLSLESISNHLSYNKKYISAVFKKETDSCVIEYLNKLRIQNACALMNQGLTSVSDIAHACGFSDPQYFSKVFKAQLKKAPMQYIKTLNEKN